MRIQNESQLEELEPIITGQNVEGCKRALKDGVIIWVFQTEAEVREEAVLTKDERNFCLRRLASGEKWAGIFRRPDPPYEPGITPNAEYDPHGNRIGGGGSNYGSIH